MLPTPALNLPDLVKNISDSDASVRIASMQSISKYGDAAVVAVPKLIDNLYYKEWSEVQISAAKALGRLGPRAKDAIPDLVIALQNDDNAYHVHETVAFSLGEIGESAAIPALADALNRENTQPYEIAINCANAIAKITHEPFRGANPSEAVYSTDEDGIPFVVLDARKWWKEKGQFQNWDN